MKNRLTIAIQKKGRLFDQSIDLIKKSGINFSTKGLSSFALASVVVICSCFKSELDKFINKAFLCDEVLFNFLCLILCFILFIY